MPSAPYLETERLRLRRFCAGEADLLIDLDSDPDVMRYISGGAPSDPDRIRSVTLPRILTWYDRGDRYGLWAAELKAGGEFAGWFHFWPAKREPHDVEVGYRLKKTFWGRGLATEGTVALIRRGFDEYGLQRVVARTLRENVASRRVLEKAGMTYLPEADYFEDLHPGSPPGVWYEIRKDPVSAPGRA